MEPIGGQRDAITVHDRSLVVEAGAGTGKTWTLVQRFLHLLEQHPDWPLESITAVTFTEKAAREMRTRLRREIEDKARQEAADSVWKERRRSLERLQVGTIHSLCARILRENAIAAGIDPRFEVLDESQAVILQEEAIHQGFAELVEADDPALELLASLQVRDLQEQIAYLLSQRGTVQQLFDQLKTPEALIERWRSGILEMREAVWRDFLAVHPAFDDDLNYVLSIPIIDETDLLATSVQVAREGCHYLSEGDIAKAAQSWGLINRKGGKGNNWGGQDALKELKVHLEVMQDAAKALNKAGCLAEVGSLDEQAARALHLWRRIWDRVVAVYARLKSEHHALDFDDLEILAERLLYQEPRDPRLQGYLDELNQLMVDEFQDTNQVQQRIVYALAHPEGRGKLFIVGDAKQSIYRFRQAQVTVFNTTAQDIQRATGYPPVQLDRSFRSHQNLLNALNHLFERILQPLSDVYADYEARPSALQADRASAPPHPAAPAPVELWLLPAKDQDDQNISAEDARIFEAQLLARRLLELHENEFPVWDKHLREYRPFRFSDAAILFRATTSLPLYEEQFKAAGLPYLTVSGRGYYDRPEVSDLLALLAALYNPADDLSLAAALRSPLFGLSDETLYRLRWHTANGERSQAAIPYAIALTQPPRNDQVNEVVFAAEVLSELWGLAGRTDPWRLLRRTLDLTGYEAALTLSDADLGGSGRQRSNLQKLLEMARQESSANLSVFLRGLQDLRAREAREGEALGSAPESGAVMLMSIHAVKGLEFPVIVVADLGRRPGRSGELPLILHDPAFGLVCKQRDENGDIQTPAGYAWGQWLINRMEAAENKRLLYVACTRAADLLILSGKQGERTSWLSDIAEVWQVGAAGNEDEIQERDGFSMCVRRPSYHPPDEVIPAQAGAPGSGIAELPALVQPVPSSLGERHFAVTHLRRALAEDAGEITALRPAVRPAQSQTGSQRAPAYLVGRVVHRALANWNNLSLPVNALETRLIAFARREGIVVPQAVHHAARRAMEILDSLRHIEVYANIDAAVQRLSEVPFTLTTPIGQLHGVIDLLFKDRENNWHLIDWKTDWFPENQLHAQALDHARQIAIYAAAARNTLGVEVNAMVCFLAVRSTVYTYSSEELNTAGAAIFG